MIKQFLRLFPYVRELEDNLQKAICGKLSLESLHLENGRVDAKLKSKIVPLVAECFYDILNDHNAVNYVEFSLNHIASNQTIIVTVQKQDGKTPHQLRVEAENKLNKQIADAKRLLKSQGYTVEEVT
jgi:DNA-directed RNA polymerase subunit L